MIQDIDEILARLLLTEMGRAPGCRVRDREQITFDPPADAEARQDGEARVNLYLFDIRENLKEKNDGMQRRSGSATETTVGSTRAPIRMDLTYLLSVYAGGDPRAEHRLLSDSLLALMRRKTIAAEYLADSAVDFPAPVLLSVAQPERSAEADPKGLWQALGGTLRPTLLVAVTAPFQPWETVWNRRVREAVYALGQGDDRQQMDAETLRARLSVAGIVADADTEAPLAGVAVQVDNESQTSLTDERGLFTLTDLAPGEYTLRFARRGYQEGTSRAAVQAPTSRTLPDPLIVPLRPVVYTEAPPSKKD